jgi:hypothetical protein
VLSFEEAMAAPQSASTQTAVIRFEPVDTWGIKDNTTGLVWTRESVAGGIRNWKDSIEAASKVDFGGHKWRAPTITELLSLVNYLCVPG